MKNFRSQRLASFTLEGGWWNQGKRLKDTVREWGGRLCGAGTGDLEGLQEALSPTVKLCASLQPTSTYWASASTVRLQRTGLALIRAEIKVEARWAGIFQGEKR